MAFFFDFLELALQFGMIMVFACAFPLLFCFAALNNVTEIRTDALKLLVMLKRPIPRAAATIGAWLNIFQFLIVMAICNNCVLLACLCDEEGKWRIEPGLAAAILIIKHVLLLIKFGIPHFVPEIRIFRALKWLTIFACFNIRNLHGCKRCRCEQILFFLVVIDASFWEDLDSNSRLCCFFTVICKGVYFLELFKYFSESKILCLMNS